MTFIEGCPHVLGGLYRGISLYMLFFPPLWEPIKDKVAGPKSVLRCSEFPLCVKCPLLYCIFSIVFFLLQSVTQQDDLFPLEGSEDWVTPIQHPQALGFQKEDVCLTLSLNPLFELEVPTHTAEQLRAMSHRTDRMEFHSRTNYNFFSSVSEEEAETFLKQVTPSKL